MACPVAYDNVALGIKTKTPRLLSNNATLKQKLEKAARKKHEIIINVSSFFVNLNNEAVTRSLILDFCEMILPV